MKCRLTPSVADVRSSALLPRHRADGSIHWRSRIEARGELRLIYLGPGFSDQSFPGGFEFLLRDLPISEHLLEAVNGERTWRVLTLGQEIMDAIELAGATDQNDANDDGDDGPTEIDAKATHAGTSER
jgi:hypothetical protein